MSSEAVNVKVGYGSNPMTKANLRKRVLPKLYSPDDLARIDQLLTKQGDLTLQVAVWFGVEEGLRLSEISKITLADIDLQGHTVLVRSRKLGRYALFSEQTEKYLRQWLSQRNPDCGHDFLLHNRCGEPLDPRALSAHFARAARKAGIPNGIFRGLHHTRAWNRISSGLAAATFRTGGWLDSHVPMCEFVSLEVLRLQRQTPTTKPITITKITDSQSLFEYLNPRISSKAAAAKNLELITN